MLTFDTYLQRFSKPKPYDLRGTSIDLTIDFPFRRLCIERKVGMTRLDNTGFSMGVGSSNIHWFIGTSPKIWMKHVYLIGPRMEYWGQLDDFDF